MRDIEAGNAPSGQSTTDQRHSLGLFAYILYALPAAPIAAMGLPIAVYLPPFYAGTLGLGLGAVGTIFMVLRFWDVVTDPILGIVSDRYKTRWGRRRHWIVISVPIIMLSMAMVFMPAEGVGPIYLLFWMIVLYVGWTLLTVSHLSWGAEISPDYNERSLIQGVREAALLIGMVLVLTLPAIIEQTQTENLNYARVASMGWFVIILLPITVALAVWRVPERANAEHHPIEFKKIVALLAKNQPLRRVLAADLLGGISGGVVTAMFLFLAEDVLKLHQWSSLLIVLYLGCGFAFIPVMVRISYRFGKHRTLCGSALFSAVTVPLILLVPEGNALVAALCWILFGINMSAGPFLLRSIMADVSDHDHVESGRPQTGLFYAMLTMTNKVGAAVAIGMAYWALDVIGFKPGEANSEAVIWGLKLTYVLPPVLVSFAVMAIMWHFPIDENQQRETRRKLMSLQQGTAD